MKKFRVNEAQIVDILKDVELGAKVSDICRKHGISDAMYYKWKWQYSGMSVSLLAHMRQLQEESSKPKRIYADLTLVHYALKDVVELKALTPERRQSRTRWGVGTSITT